MEKRKQDPFKNYQIQKEDFEKIEEGVSLIFENKLRDIFPKNNLYDTDIETFDSKYIYLWSKENYKLKETDKFKSRYLKIYEFPLKENLKPDDLFKNFALKTKFNKTKNILEKYKKIGIPDIAPKLKVISLPPYKAEIEKRKKLLYKNYYKEGYVPKIIHEFAHIYFKMYSKKSSFDDFEKYKRAFPIAKKIWEEKEVSKKALKEFSIVPAPIIFQEIFAYLSGLECAERFYPKYSKIEKKLVTNMINYETKSKERLKESFLKNESWSRLFFCGIYAQIIKKNYPNWYDWLLKV